MATATPIPKRDATSCAPNGPCVRAWRRTRSPSGSGTGSVKTSGMPVGRATPSASRSRPASSTTAHCCATASGTPARRTWITRRAPSRPVSQAGTSSRTSSRVRRATSAAGSGPSLRSRSHTSSACRAWRPGTRAPSSASVRSTDSGSSRSASCEAPPSVPSSSARSVGSSESAAARRSARGASPSYRNWAVYPNRSDWAKGDGVGVVTSTSRTLPAARSRMSSVRAATSKSSWRHSRAASRTIGNSGYSLATESSWAERCRCCHRGWRLSGRRRGSSRARAAASRKRAANMMEPPSSARTSSRTSSGARSRSSAVTTGEPAPPGPAVPPGSSPQPPSPRSGSRSTIPSSECMAAASRP
ncbi:hypothetical protein OJAG_00250 [Oerskovia enterophila]|uniref:Uncharacterized protein n=1 Tax=Oerskovia enterophila TaxID=43678 RepID=A0A163T9I4_9CELL|nr:hypothetical protein OJAG_00250 [Oerskovia enterophila]